MKTIVMKCCVSAVFLLLAACGLGQGHQHSQEEYQPAAEVNKGSIAPLTVELMNTKGAKVGIATLTEEKNGVRIKIEAKGLTPGRHGFHIHEIGKCEVPDFKTAGGHFNPYDRKHGFKNPKGPHGGDLPNLEADERGTIKAETFASLVTLEEGKPNSLLDVDGSSLVIHAGPDDYETDPAGNSGDRVICGVITK
ncbi:superoxide dismutase [Priestia aryabhattai]|uniref:superoxide dismutase family protein n=1 Tax=Bacillaceae TaxID=186817 RepID=UPI000BA1431A|nr:MULTISPECIES: superoxide dismutase family protein [Bacillaceae]MDT2047129.1 superoxide dismutase family protein [Priestia flexa]OZT14289.1 superoxide dismutase [Priestia aryabhattai]TDB54897.1 superoxide dismutase family protein [Bacillus sp. CBEL-1]USY56748.1 superoxide dismutase family protein [Bacillus sp. 1780r2a1]